MPQPGDPAPSLDLSRAAGVQVGDGNVQLNSGTVLVGDHNVVVLVDGQALADAPIPTDAPDVARLLFVPEGPLHAGLPSLWLRPDSGVIPVQPRHEVDTLLSWARDEQHGPLLRLVCGEGGQGKTHAARQVCEALRSEGWLAGFVALPPPDWQSVGLGDLERAGTARAAWVRALRRVPELVAGIRGAAATGLRTLLVVDYAENAGPLVGELLDTIRDAGAEDRVRVLLLARYPDGWYAELAGRYPTWASPAPLYLSSLPQQAGQRGALTLWQRAVAVFSARAAEDGMTTPGTSVPVPAELPSGNWETALDLYADAALHVLDAISPRTGPAEGDAVEGVLQHERRQVSAALAGAGCPIDPDQRNWALLAVCLRPAAGLDAAERALAAVPARWRIEDTATAAITLGRLYPHPLGEVWCPPRPDRLADAHLLDVMGTLPDVDWRAGVVALCGDADLLAATHASTVLVRCLSNPTRSPRQAAAKTRLIGTYRSLLEEQPENYVVPLAILAPGPLQDDIVAVLSEPGRVSLPTLIRIDAMLEILGFSVLRATVAVVVSLALATAMRPAADAPPADVKAFADVLNVLGARLRDLGEHEKSLAAATEALALYQGLVDQGGSEYVSYQALALNNRSVDLLDLDRAAESLAAATQATEIFRRLEADTGDYAAALASALTSRSLALSALGQYADADDATREALEIRRTLAAAHPTLLPLLATSLTNHAADLARLQRPAEALVAAREATEIRRRLATVNADAHLPDLAAALSNLTVHLSDAGQFDEALPLAEEGVRLRRALVQLNPSAYRKDLAMALYNFGALLIEGGRHAEATAVTEEAVDIRRAIAADSPLPRHLAELAGGLSNLGVALAGERRLPESLAAAQEALAIRRRLSDADPDVYLADLAGSLDNVGIVHSELEQHEEALAPTEQAVALYRTLVARAPAIHRAELGGSLNNLSVRLGMLDRGPEAVAAATEALEIFENLQTFGPQVARTLTVLAWAHLRAGEVDTAARIAADSASRLEPYALAHPEAYGELHRSALTIRDEALEAG